MQWWECGWFYEAWLCSIFIILAARLLYYSRIFRLNVENKHHLLALNFCYQIIYRTSYKHTDRDLVATKHIAYRHLPSRQASRQAGRRANRCAERKRVYRADQTGFWPMLYRRDYCSSISFRVRMTRQNHCKQALTFLPLSALRTRILDTCANCKRPKKGTEHLNEVIKIQRQVKTKRKWNEIENERKRNAKRVCVCVYAIIPKFMMLQKTTFTCITFVFWN